MSNENYNVEVREEKPFHKSKWVKKFLTGALASFVGVFCALSLFAALHKPPMPPCPCGCGMRAPICHHHHHFDRGDRGGHFERGDRGHQGDFQRQALKDGMDRKVPVRVEVKD